ncbi:MAG: hypothetical protein ACI83W_000652 [Marinoscillum sp.]|jgi:uncharacterized protein (DUF983 family)
MKEKGALSAVLEGKCPNCRKGNMFKYPLLAFTKFNNMYTHCPECDLRFEREPGFFYGAMYMSYALSVAIFFISVFILYVIIGDPSLTYYISTITIVSILLYPFTFRYSRILFMYAFSGVSYHSEKLK